MEKRQRQGERLGARVPIPATEPEAISTMASILSVAVPDRVEVRQASTTTDSASASTSSCASDSNSPLCEKPVSSSTFTLPIILGIAIPLVSAAILFIYLQRRHVKKQREEDANDRHASMDFGLGMVPPGGKARRKRTTGVGAAVTDLDMHEKGSHRERQVSMDMTSPYLLPPELQSSRESLHSLSRTIHQHEDPYRPVTQYYPNDGASMRSYSRPGRDGSSIYTGSSGAPSKMQDLANSDLLSNAAMMSRNSPPNDFVPPPRQNSLPQSNIAINPVNTLSNNPLPPVPPPYPSNSLAEPPRIHIQGSAQPAGVQRKGLPTNPRPGRNNSLAPASTAGMDGRDSFISNDDTALRQSNGYLGAVINSRDQSPTPPSPPNKSADQGALPIPESTIQQTPARKSPPTFNSLPVNPRPARKESLSATQAPPQTFMDDESEYGDGFQVTPPSPGRENKAEHMQGQRYSMDVPPEEFAQAGLGAPGFDPRRISMGFRPLPPDTVTESEDPETRANRIRSFYKEYFDESKPAPQGQYYEDYDENYLGDAAYFDPESNNFVMPYTQPVTRRAMTPPPRGARFQRPPRAMHGSMGGMSTGGIVPRGMYPPGSRAYSSASGRMGPPGPKRPLPPPAALNSLPTPSRLKDDSFALMNSIDFAPPTSYRDRQVGRSQSPLGERRPYSPSVPSHRPLASAFDELAPMPSPHLLRKSGTFTGLDFAPPKRFKDPDSMSDAGSIRSNRSGVSAMQLGAIRNGAYRVSRIPQEVVGSKEDLAATLKPQWGMRVGN